MIKQKIVKKNGQSKNYTNPKVKPTGISELDSILHGGIPKGHIVLVAGSSGTGKTILSMQWLFNGFIKYKEPGLYITLTEPITKSIRNLKKMSFYDASKVNHLSVHLTDMRSIVKLLDLQDKELNKAKVDEIVETIENLVKRMEAQRVVIDSITAMAYLLKDKDLIRYFIFSLGTMLSNLDCTTIITSEVVGDCVYSVFGVEEYISDGVISLTNLPGENQMIRRLQVIKMRGSDFRTGSIIFNITPNGLLLYPKIPINREVASTEYKIRISSGIPKFDGLIGGGYPQGHVVMITGNTGTGKTTWCLQFMIEGLQKGESVVHVTLEESATQIKKTAQAHGWDLENYEKAGKLKFVNPGLIDIYPDKVLYQIVNAVNKMKARRMVLDSTSSLENASLDKDKVREFLLQLTGFCKTKGLACLLTYLSENAFGASKDQLIGIGASSELRLSSIVDGLILLRYVERRQSVRKLLNVLKMRGSIHDKNIWEFTVDKSGVKIGDKFKE